MLCVQIHLIVLILKSLSTSTNLYLLYPMPSNPSFTFQPPRCTCTFFYIRYISQPLGASSQISLTPDCACPCHDLQTNLGQFAHPSLCVNLITFLLALSSAACYSRLKAKLFKLHILLWFHSCTVA